MLHLERIRTHLEGFRVFAKELKVSFDLIQGSS